jgi:hypothetical protein
VNLTSVWSFSAVLALPGDGRPWLDMIGLRRLGQMALQPGYRM